MTDLFLFKPQSRKFQQKKTNKVKKIKMINMSLIKQLRAKKKNFVSYLHEFPRKLRYFYHDRRLNSPYFYNYTKVYLKDHKNRDIKFSMDHLEMKEIFRTNCPKYYNILTRYSDLKVSISGYDVIEYLKKNSWIPRGKARIQKKIGIKRQFIQNFNRKLDDSENCLFNLELRL